MKPAFRLKRPHGWFAAGAEFERAIQALSDRAFKGFAQVCLRAERANGCLEVERDGLARELGKSRSALGRCLRELAAKGVCELEAAPNQHCRSRLRVRPEYWPYEVREEPAGQEPESLGGEPVRSLRYFASLLEEVVTESFPDSYWQHLEFNLRRCERLWQEGRAEAPGSARPDLEQADPSREDRKTSSAAEAEREERG